jgi:hypothetical protein
MEIEIVKPSQSVHKKAIINTNNSHQDHALRDSLLIFSVVGFFVLGFATASYFDLFESQISEAQTIKLTTFANKPFQHLNNQIDMAYENCLGTGTGESITITCPNEKGYVYKAVLAMPHELAAKFSNDVFHIRGISLSENSESTVILKYQNKFYSTRFLETEKV